MTQRIFKYPLPMGDEVKIDMPIGAQVLCVQCQGNAPMIWALVDDTAEKQQRTLMIRGTGHDCNGLDDKRYAEYVGTFQLMGGDLVFHVFQTVQK